MGRNPINNGERAVPVGFTTDRETRDKFNKILTVLVKNNFSKQRRVNRSDGFRIMVDLLFDLLGLSGKVKNPEDLDLVIRKFNKYAKTLTTNLNKFQQDSGTESDEVA